MKMYRIFLFATLLLGGIVPAESAPVCKFGGITPFHDFEKRIDWSWNGAWKEKVEDREKISLNGFWNYLPAAKATTEMPADCPFYFHVPAQCRGGSVSHFVRYRDGQAVSAIDGVPTGRGYNTPSEFAIFRRTLDLPPALPGKKIYFASEQITSKSFRLGVNGKNVPVPPGFSAGKIDVTQYLKPGEKNTFELKLDLSGDPMNVSGGPTGNLFLEIIPERNLGEPAINTSLEKRKITVEFFSWNLGNNVGDAEFLLTDAKTGETVFRKKLPLRQKVELDFITPKLWTPESPNLYFMTITAFDADGKKIETVRRRFGFREFRIFGGKFLLNGKEFFLRGDTNALRSGGWTPAWKKTGDYYRRYFRHLKDTNLNFCYASRDIFPEFFDIADEIGFLIIVSHNQPYHEMWNNNDEYIYRKLERDLKLERQNVRLMNHPSQIGILTDVWYNMHQGVMNPEYVGRKYDSPTYRTFQTDGKVATTSRKDPNLGGMRVARKQRLDRMTEIYRGYFPEFACFTGGSGEAGGIYATHLYHTWGAPNLELRAFFSRWAMQKELPIFIGEYFIPYNVSLRRIDVLSGAKSTPYYLENTARFFGNLAYRYKPSYTILTMHDAADYTSVVSSTLDHKPGKTYYFTSDFYTDLIRRSVEEMIPGFLYSGLTGVGTFGHAEEVYAGQLRRNFYSLPLPAGNLSAPGQTAESVELRHLKRPSFDIESDQPDYRYSEVAAPMLSMMAGHYAGFFDAGRDPYEINHAFYGGEETGKNLLILNHTAQDAAWKVRISLRSAAGELLQTEDAAVSVKAAGRAELPVRMKLPAFHIRRDLVLRADLTDKNGKRIHAAFNLEVFPRENAPLAKLASPVTVFGAEESFLHALRKLGVPAKSISRAEEIQEDGIVIFGKGAFGKGAALPDLQDLADRGGRILILEQTPDCSLELQKARSRQAFINAPGHPVLAGFRDRDFYCWRGSHSIANAYQENTTERLNWSDNGNRNMVASYVFRRPSAGNLRSLLVSGFDLHQTPLLEYTGRKGSWIACQLEISDRIGTDPAPTRLLVNLLSFLDSRRAFAGDTAFFGGEKGRQLLRKYHAEFKELSELNEATLADVGTLIVSDPDFETLDRCRLALLNYVYYGGRVIYLHTGEAWRSTWLPFALPMTDKTMRGALVRSDSPDLLWRCGWDNNDLYWHDSYKLPVFEAPGQIDAVEPGVTARKKYGSGEFVFTTVIPERFGKTPAQGKASRLLSALLTSGGVRMNLPMQPFKPSGALDFDLVPYLWEFALDPQNVALQEKWHLGKRGSAAWMQGQISNDGTHVQIGMPFEQFLRKAYDGWVMYRLSFDLDGDFLKTDPLYFQAGAIDDFDEVYLNGKLIGKTGEETTTWWLAPRLYRIPAGLLKERGNLLAVRIFDKSGGGGMVNLPVSITNAPSIGAKGWSTPYPDGVRRDYEYKADMIRSY